MREQNEGFTPVTDTELDDHMKEIGTGSLNWNIASRVGNELRALRRRRTLSETTPAAAVELAQLSRELVQYSREMRAQEKKIVELETQRDMFKQAGDDVSNAFMKLHGALVQIANGDEAPINLAVKALEKIKTEVRS